MKRKAKDRDRHLDVPAEANRDKHINFLAMESGDRDPGDQPATGKLANKDLKGHKKRTGSDSQNKSK